MFFFFKQKTAYEMRISDWSSDVCSSDLRARELTRGIGRDMFEHRAVAQVDVPVVGAADRQAVGDRKSVVSGKSVSVRVDLGGRRIIQKKTSKNESIIIKMYTSKSIM